MKRFCINGLVLLFVAMLIVPVALAEKCIGEFVTETVRLYPKHEGKADRRIKWRQLDEFKKAKCLPVLDEKKGRVQIEIDGQKYWVKRSKVASNKKLEGSCVEIDGDPNASTRAAGEC